MNALDYLKQMLGGQALGQGSGGPLSLQGALNSAIGLTPVQLAPSPGYANPEMADVPQLNDPDSPLPPPDRIVASPEQIDAYALPNHSFSMGQSLGPNAQSIYSANRPLAVGGDPVLPRDSGLRVPYMPSAQPFDALRGILRRTGYGR